MISQDKSNLRNLQRGILYISTHHECLNVKIKTALMRKAWNYLCT